MRWFRRIEEDRRIEELEDRVYMLENPLLFNIGDMVEGGIVVGRRMVKERIGSVVTRRIVYDILSDGVIIHECNASVLRKK